MGSHSLQGIFPSPGLPRCRRILCCPSQRGRPAVRLSVEFTSFCVPLAWAVSGREVCAPSEHALVVPDGTKGVGSVPVPAPVRSAVCPRDFLPALLVSPASSCSRGPSGHTCLAGVSQGKRHHEDTRRPVPGERIGLGLRSQSPPDPRAGRKGRARARVLQGRMRGRERAGSGRRRRGGRGSTEPCLQQEAPGREPSLPGQGLED